LESFDLTEPGSEGQSGENVLPLEVVIVLEDLLVGHTGAQQFQDDFDRVPQVADSRLAVADVRVDCDALEQCFGGHG
jgi:hypothetical protein